MVNSDIFIIYSGKLTELDLRAIKLINFKGLNCAPLPIDELINGEKIEQVVEI